MIIDLNENYRVETDEFNFILQEKRRARNRATGANTVSYKNIGYYPNLSSLIKALLNREILLSKVVTFQDLENFLEERVNSIVGMLAHITLKETQHKVKN